MTSSVPLSAATRSDRPRSPEPSLTLAPPTPSSLHLHQQLSVDALDPHRRVLGARVLRHVRERLRDHEVGRGLDGGGQATGALTDDVDRDGRARGQRAYRRLEPALGQHHGMDAARQIAQLLEALPELVDRAVEERRRVGTVGHAHACEPEVQRQRDEPRLRAVVEVALDAPPFAVGRLDQPRPRGAQLDQARAQLGIEALVLQRQGGGRAGGPNRLGVLRAVVHDGGDMLAVVVDLGHGAADVVRAGQLGRRSCRVDVAVQLGHPERQLQRRVAERSRERVPQVRALGRVRELGHERAHAARAREVRAGQPREERERRGGEGRERHPQQRVDLTRRVGGDERRAISAAAGEHRHEAAALGRRRRAPLADQHADRHDAETERQRRAQHERGVAEARVLRRSAAHCADSRPGSR